MFTLHTILVAAATRIVPGPGGFSVIESGGVFRVKEGMLPFSLDRPVPIAMFWKRAILTLMILPAIPFSFGGGRPDAALDAALDAVAPELRKLAVLCLVRDGENGAPVFDWVEYRDTADRKDFWPASTVKLHAVIAAMERVREAGFDLDVTATFEHREADGKWVLDCARTLREMSSEVFRRSSNEDYTLLLRLAGIDWIHTEFLTAERGFPNSALMRGYVKSRPWVYEREEAQRIRLASPDGSHTAVIEHRWSGRSYSEERGATVIDAKTGNVTTPRELAECLRRILFHEHLPGSERFRISPAQLQFLREGGGGLSGLATVAPESGPSGWTGAAGEVFPQARYFHKSGLISDHALELGYVDDSANGGPRYLFVPVIAAGHATKPIDGETLVGRMSLEIAKWVKASSK